MTWQRREGEADCYPRYWKATDLCHTTMPELKEMGDGHKVACQFPIMDSLGSVTFFGPDCGLTPQPDTVVHPPSEVLQDMESGRALRPKDIDYAGGEEPY